MSKSFFIDLTKCTACRGCQVACKQWNKLPAGKTVNHGSYQNPDDLNFNTYKLVRFTEKEADGRLNWLFFTEQCRHCMDPTCKSVMDDVDPKAVVIDEASGAVVFTELTSKAKDIRDPEEMCPYNVPRRDAKTGRWSKCTMCVDRTSNGLLPACVQTCPTGAMNFGDREDMLSMARNRLTEVKKAYPQAVLGDPDFVRTIYLFPYPPELYHPTAVAEAVSPGLTRGELLATMAKPLRKMFS